MGKRIISRRRGSGTPTYRSPSHRHHGTVAYPAQTTPGGTVVSIKHAPGRSAPVSIIELDDGRRVQLIAADGLYVRQKLDFSTGAAIERGNIKPLANIPEGTRVFNIEARPGDGGKFVRTAGSTATVVGHGDKSIVQMPTGQFKHIDNHCRATIGIIAAGGRKERPFAKAGKKYHAYRSKAKGYVKVSGVAMNPANHPHGGGSHQHVGRPSTVSKRAPPGAKVGRFGPKKKIRKGR